MLAFRSPALFAVVIAISTVNMSGDLFTHDDSSGSRDSDNLTKAEDLKELKALEGNCRIAETRLLAVRARVNPEQRQPLSVSFSPVEGK
jgi:hypothetical protein